MSFLRITSGGCSSGGSTSKGCTSKGCDPGGCTSGELGENSIRGVHHPDSWMMYF